MKYVEGGTEIALRRLYSLLATMFPVLVTVAAYALMIVAVGIGR